MKDYSYMKEKMTKDYLSKYTNHHCILVKKYRLFFLYVWILEENVKRFRVRVGEQLYSSYNIGDKLTVGRVGVQLINIRPGFCRIIDK